MSILLEKFLIKNNFTHFNKKAISLQLLTHPDNPSFRSLTDTLDYFGIENVAAHVPEEALEILPANFLTLINENGQQLVLATKKKGWVFTENEDGKKSKFDVSEFKKRWSRNIIAIEKSTQSDSLTNIREYWFVIPVVLLITFIFLKEPPIVAVLRMVFAGLGLYISYLLVKEKVGFHSPSVLSVCTSLPNSNCNDVINSKGGNITKNLSLADASFLYFIVLLIANIILNNNLIISTMLLLGIPVSLYSIYYQGLILKKWCPLCIGIVIVLGLSASTLIWEASTLLSNMEIIVFLLFLSLLIPAYFYVKNLIEKSRKQEQEIIASRRFKRNPEIFQKIMADAEVINDTALIKGEIIIGNENATTYLITYTNPLCGHCRNAFESYLKIVEMYPDIKIVIRLNTEAEDFDSPSTQISCKLIEINNEKGTQEFINAYISWFKDKNIDEWLKKYGKPKFKQSYLLLLQEHKKWALNNKISYTPATIIGNKIFPSSYNHDDLVYVIKDIIDDN